jgi:hypothetical protein
MALMGERYPKLFLEIFFSDRIAMDRYLDIAAGRSDYKQFRRWLLKRLPRTLFSMLFSTAPVRT